MVIQLICSVLRIDGIWTLFDFVRNRKGAWGSNSDVPYRKINALGGNGPREVTSGSRFGFSMANLGDLDGDGIDDLAVGACGETNTYDNPLLPGQQEVELKSGAVYILFMTSNGTAKSSTRIGGRYNGGPMLYNQDEFGYSVSALGDLDGDGVLDMAVGAPGVYVSSVYILYLFPNGSCKSYKLIRGHYIGTAPIKRNSDGTWPNNSYIPNGPDLSYSSRLGTAMTSIGDWDKDGIPDLAVSVNHIAGGKCSVYLLYMFRNGTVKSYTELGVGINGGPTIPDAFSSFGTSIMLMPDHDNDGVPELIIGAKHLDDQDTSHFHSGVLFFCFMKADGTIKSFTRISELSDASGPAGPLPLTAEDNCGSGVAQIGDINKDNMRQHWPLLLSPQAEKRPSTNDIIIGCPQSNTEKETGRIFSKLFRFLRKDFFSFSKTAPPFLDCFSPQCSRPFITRATVLFLSEKANVKGYRLLPSATDIGVAPKFRPRAQVGASMVSIQDLDDNGLREIVVGAPGDDESGSYSGAIYVFYFRRRRWHPFVPDTRSWLCKIIIPPSIAAFFCILSIIYCCYKFRRKPDEIELMVKAAGVEIGTDGPGKIKKKRKKKGGVVGGEEKGDAQVYADDF